jgi:hypothetical protein
MPRFLGDRDINFMRQINKELLNEVVETPVILYKLDIKKSPTNIYGEAPKKVYHAGVQVSCLINRQDKATTSDGYVLDFSQTSTFSFLRETLKEKNIYPEVGDLIEYDSSFYEINNVVENQLLGDQPFLNWSIICVCHLTKKSQLQLTPRNHIPNEMQ